MTDAPLTPREEDDALAAEYVLGVLDLTERAAVAARLKHDAGFAALVADWELKLGGLNDDFDEAPAPNLLPQIEARLFPKSPAPKARRFGLNFGWLTGGLVAAVLALASIATLAPPRPELVASLATADNRLAYARDPLRRDAADHPRRRGSRRVRPGARAVDHRAQRQPSLAGPAAGQTAGDHLPDPACGLHLRRFD